MASHVPKPVNINRADEAELKSLPQIGRFQAQAIIAARNHQGGRLTEDDFKAIPKLGAEVWQPLLDQKAINFGSPAPVPTARCDPKSMSSASSAEDTPKPNGVFCRYCSGTPYPINPCPHCPGPSPVSAPVPKSPSLSQTVLSQW